MRSKTANTIIVALTLLCSCIEKIGYSSFQPINEQNWKRSDVIHFKPITTDSLSTYDVKLAVRNSDIYPFQNLTLCVAYKEGTDISFDTINVVLANEHGEWLGEPNGKIWTTILTLRKEKLISTKKPCALSIKQIMKEDNLKGIVNIGVILEKP